MNNVEEFLKDWRKKNNTASAVYSSYHIDAMEAYAKKMIEDFVAEHNTACKHPEALISSQEVTEYINKVQ